MDRAYGNVASNEVRMNSFIDRVKSRSAVVGVIGQGYVGLPLALVFNESGFQVVGFDVDGGKIRSEFVHRSGEIEVGRSRRDRSRLCRPSVGAGFQRVRISGGWVRRGRRKNQIGIRSSIG